MMEEDSIEIVNMSPEPARKPTKTGCVADIVQEEEEKESDEASN